MNIKQFIKQHKDNWQQLDAAIQHLHTRKHQVTSQDIDRFYRLYQKTAQNLSYAQTYFPQEEMTVYLNTLVAKAHNMLYKDQVSSGKQIKQFFTVTFIQLLWDQYKAVIIAMGLFLLGAAGSFLAVLSNPDHIYAILPSEITAEINPERLNSNPGTIDGSFMSASIMTNNIQVAFLAFAGGITFGILTVYVLMINGIMVGGLAAFFWHYSKTYVFWAYIVPHGIIELTAIFIAGGAGLLMGYKLLVPGNYSRGYQLKIQATRSIQLILGTIPLFVIAGIIEGFITPAAISLEMKYAVALLTLFGLILYVGIGKMVWSKTDTIHL
ncbi:stage II sporulation protein M [Virgibacillus soli]|uniref:stage II sporulation protein M n=1 Tax=Paracerasibacillus soli TaxID=480284 RepID=UPI0035EA3D31